MALLFDTLHNALIFLCLCGEVRDEGRGEEEGGKWSKKKGLEWRGEEEDETCGENKMMQ